MSGEIRATFNKVFKDFKNYPYGFSRSGDFSIKESQLLEKNGRWMAALADATISPESEQEQRLVAVIRGELTPSTDVEKVWMKYQKRINRPHVSALSTRTVAREDDDDDVDPVDLEDDED